MKLFKITSLLVICWQIASSEITTSAQGNSLLCCKLLSQNELNAMSIAFIYQDNRSKHHQTNLQESIQQLLLVMSGTVEVNPGPKYPCGECHKAVSSGASIACDICNQWFHLNCTSMSNNIFECYELNENLEWQCPGCVFTNISDGLFDSSISSNGSTNSDDTIPNRKKAKRLRISVCNFRSIWNKQKLLGNYLHQNDIDILIGSESHLSCNIKNSEFLPEHYLASRKDRNKDGKGGVIIIYKDTLLVEELPTEQAEIVSIKVESFEKPVLFTACYRPPKCTDEYNTKLIKGITNITKKYKLNPHWICGDFNLPDICWESNTIIGHQYPKKLNEDFLEAFDKLKLSQTVNFTTRLNSTLDLILTNRPGLIESCEPLPGFSDHETAIISDIYCHPQKIKPIQKKVRLWHRANMDELQQDIKTGIENLCATHTIHTDINTLWAVFKQIITKAEEKHVPTKTTSKRFNQPWFNTACKRAVRKKKRRYKVFQRTHLKRDWSRFQGAAKDARKTCQNAYNDYLKKNIYQDKGHSKKFFAFVKSKRTDLCGVSPLVDSKNVIHTDEEKLAELLNDQFTSVFSKDDGKIPMPNDPPGTKMEDITITRNGIVKLLKDLNPHKASGPDGIGARILKECAEQVVDGLVLLFNASLNQGKIPNEWKHAIVTPLYKGGNKNRSKAENYRPISLTSVTSKILEHVIHSNVITHLETQGLLSDTQHGFRKKRSCETQLLQTIDTLAKAINNKDQLDSILLDFSKAFDKVSHRKLIIKMKHYGISGNILSWITDFLSNRTQCVVVRGKSSKNSPVISGVPQGTVLGPLLFLIYINDMPSKVKSRIALFADDAYLYRSIKSPEDTKQLQNDLNELVTWENDWSMSFHPDKCFVLRITNKHKIIDSTYEIHGKQLKLVNKAKYLGVVIAHNLSWKHHINSITAKATNTRLFLQRNLPKSDKETRLTCYKTFIRPIVEYACTVWDPVENQSLIKQVEMIQRKSIRWIMNEWSYDISPNELRKSLKMETLECRRYKAKLNMLNDIVAGRKFIDPNIHPTRQRCTNVKYQPIQGRILSYSNSYFPSVVKCWNKLPSKVANLDNENEFRKAILEISL